MKIVFATGNAGKIKEIKSVLGDLGLPVISMKEAGTNIDIEENGTTFEENALIKARAVFGAVNDNETVVMADDSGLEIDALMKEPGIHSSRYLGENTPYETKNRKIIERLKGVENEKRTARFVCAIAAVFPDGEEAVCTGTFEGKIGYEIRGENGFGYDPIFYLPDMSRSAAELSPEEKNSISHRGKALEAIKPYIYQKVKRDSKG